MRNLIIIPLLIISLGSWAQKQVKDSTKSLTPNADRILMSLTDSTAIFSVDDINIFFEYLADKYTYKQYMEMQQWWRQQIATRRRILMTDKQKKK